MYLYTITNTVTGRKYYGITVNPKQRWFVHKSAAKHKRYKSPLCCAMNSYGLDKFVMEVIEEGSEEYISNKEIALIASDSNSYNLHKGGHIGFDVTTKDEAEIEQWKAQLRNKRKGRTPALGMSHTEETKKLCGQYAKLRWDLYGRYPAEVTSLSFVEAKAKYGISKTHYYRLRHSTNEAV